MEVWLTFLTMLGKTLHYTEFCDYSHRKDSTAFTYISSFQPEILSIYYQSEKVGHIPRMHVLRSLGIYLRTVCADVVLHWEKLS